VVHIHWVASHPFLINSRLVFGLAAGAERVPQVRMICTFLTQEKYLEIALSLM
jgi:hypothetical protein